MIKGRNVKFFRILFVISLICIGSRGVLAEPYDLAELGAILPSIIVDAENVSVNLKVNLANDEALRTFVMAHTAAGSVLQRNNLGYWIPWSGKLSDLVNNFSSQIGQELFVKILKEENMSNELFPIRITVGYETSSKFKFGVFELIKEQN
jgi:ribosomal protein S1